MRVTHLTLSDQTRRLAAMRAAQLRRSMSEYVARLIQTDADTVGLSEFLSTKTPDEPTAVPGGGR